MDNIVDAMMGIDKRNEIFNLWYEVTYLRLVVSQMFPNKQLADIDLDIVRKDAQEIVRKRFPLADIKFTDPKNQEEKNEESSS